MKKQVLETIEQVEIYPIISFVIFGLFFVATSFYVAKMSKKLVSDMKALPLDDQPEK